MDLFEGATEYNPAGKDQVKYKTWEKYEIWSLADARTVLGRRQEGGWEELGGGVCVCGSPGRGAGPGCHP